MKNFISQNAHHFDLKDSIYYLKDSFYRGMRSVLSEERLKKLDELVRDIPEPELFGSYRDDLHYLKTLNLMLNSTDETRRRGLFIKKGILPYLNPHNKLLDLGTGNGQLISWIGNRFNYITAVDINKEAINLLNVNKHILHPHIFLEKINSSIFDVQFKSNHYDLTLLSHVLYYIKDFKWLEAIEKAYQATRSNGVIIIALSGDGLDKANLIKDFGGYPIEINRLFKECKFYFGNEFTEMFVSQELIVSRSLFTMLHIAGFFLYDVGVTAKKESLINYIKQCYQKDKNFYSMRSQQKFIVIKKQ